MYDTHKTITLAALAAAFGALALGGSPANAQNYDRPAQPGHITWSGSVDDTTIITLHRGDVDTRVVFGKDAGNVSTQIVGRLPDRPAYVFLEDRRGRGRVQIIQQPSPSNDFTARVRLRDPQPGKGLYHFVLAWRPDHFDGERFNGDRDRFGGDGPRRF